MHRSISPFAISVLFGLMATGLSHAQSPAPPAKVDLKLFETSEVDRSRGCTVVLWQDDRDPDKDRYAYSMVETLGRNHVRESTRIKVGTEILTFRRIAVGGAKEFGYKSFPYQVYKMDKEDSFLILDLKLEDSPGEAVDITGGTMTVIRPKLPPFSTTVKGNAGSNTPAAAPARSTPARTAATAGTPAPGMFEKYAVRAGQVPAALKRSARQKFKCDEKLMGGPVSGYQMSEESALWEIPCEEHATGQSYVYALVYLTDPAKMFEFKGFKVPAGINRSGDPALLHKPSWDLKSRTVTSVWLEGAGDCGSYERYRVTEDGSFALVEFREKTMCDGKKMPPKDFPLMFPK